MDRSTRPHIPLAPSLKGAVPNRLGQVWQEDYRRLHLMAVELAKLPDAIRHERLDSLEQWERLQVLDEIRHAAKY